VHAEAQRCWCASRARSVQSRTDIALGTANAGRGTLERTPSASWAGRFRRPITNGTMLDASMTVLWIHRN